LFNTTGTAGKFMTAEDWRNIARCCVRRAFEDAVDHPVPPNRLVNDRYHREMDSEVAAMALYRAKQ
jgi:hypothetical protein